MSEASQFFLSCYILWVIGMLEPEMVDELDRMTPPGVENWRQVMHRECRLSQAQVRARFLKLCEVMSDDGAVEVVLKEFASGHVVDPR